MVIDQGYNSFEVRPGRRHPLPFDVVAERMPNCELIAARANGHFSVVSDRVPANSIRPDRIAAEPCFCGSCGLVEGKGAVDARSKPKGGFLVQPRG
jgi:hypothetical protein